jgi:hypothetical protein
VFVLMLHGPFDILGSHSIVPSHAHGKHVVTILEVYNKTIVFVLQRCICVVVSSFYDASLVTHFSQRFMVDMIFPT